MILLKKDKWDKNNEAHQSNSLSPFPFAVWLLSLIATIVFINFSVKCYKLE